MHGIVCADITFFILIFKPFTFSVTRDNLPGLWPVTRITYSV